MGNISSSTPHSKTNIVSGKDANSTAAYIAKDLPHFIIEQSFPTGSGRFFRSFRIRCPTNTNTKSDSNNKQPATNYTSQAGPEHEQGSPSLICKAIILRYPETNSDAVRKDLLLKAKELARLKESLRSVPNILTYQEWSLSNFSSEEKEKSTDSNSTVTFISQPTYLFRQHVYSTLSDRLTMRPFLTNVEKNFIAFQILKALDAMHARGIHHGNLTTDNICVTSWNWIYLVVSFIKERKSFNFEYITLVLTIHIVFNVCKI